MPTHLSMVSHRDIPLLLMPRGVVAAGRLHRHAHTLTVSRRRLRLGVPTLPVRGTWLPLDLARS